MAEMVQFILCVFHHNNKKLEKTTSQSFTLTEDYKGLRGWEEGRGLPGPPERGCSTLRQLPAAHWPVDTQCRGPRLTP